MVKCYKENYFRPQFVRDKWIDLSGKWDFVFDDKNVGEAEQYYLRFPEKFLNIAVPYSYETPARKISLGINQKYKTNSKFGVGKVKSFPTIFLTA